MHSSVLSLVLLAFLPQAPAIAQEGGGAALDVLHLVRVQGRSLGPRPAEALARLDLDVANHHAPTSGALDIVADADDLARLEAAGVPYELVVEDLVAHYESRLTGGAVPENSGAYGRWLSPPFASGSMGGYYTYAQTVAVLDQMAAAYPQLVAPRQSIGTSIEGRSIWMVKISDNPLIDEGEPEVRVDAVHHAREPGGLHATLWFMLSLLEDYGSDPLATYLVNERELYFVPIVNVDGYVYNQTTNPGGGGMWRKNRRDNGGGVFGVDLNRNYPEKWGWDNVGSSGSPSSGTYRGTAPASEPEVQAITAFIASRQFRTALTVHTYSNYWMHPYGYANLEPANVSEYAEIEALATVVNGYEVGPTWDVLYLINGGTQDFDHNQHQGHSWLVEIGSSGDGFWPPTSRIVPLAEENRVGMGRTALAAGAWLRVLAVDRAEVGDGDGFFEPGESAELRLTVRNSGRGASATPIVARLVSVSPHATVTAGQHVFGAVAPFAQTVNSASPLALSIAPGAPAGAVIDYTLELEYEGWTQSLAGSVSVGAPVPFLRDDAELGLGWTLGVAGDTATTGLWERAAPIGTTSSGQPANPSADATPAPGTDCYVTGNGGGAAGNDDVDGGATTLLSPAFDLSAVGPARLAYSRWFANLGNADDDFRAYLSNDDGQNWSPLETVSTNANQWNRVEFLVTDVLPQTSRMRLRFVAADLGVGSIYEAGVDDLDVVVFDSAPRLNVYGDESAGGNVVFHVTGTPGDTFHVATSTVDPAAVVGPYFQAPLFGGSALTGTIGVDGLGRVVAAVPSSPWLVGATFYFRAVVGSGGGGWTATNGVSLVVQ